MTLRIALAGIDGAGKSTLVRRLLERPQLSGASVLKKDHREAAQMLLRLHPDLRTGAGQVHGPMAAGLRWAHGIDFLHYWESTARPAFEDGSLLLLDRWKVCFEAGAGLVPGLGLDMRALLAPVPEADVVLFLEIDPEEAHHRLGLRGPRQPDEELGPLRALRHGYDEALSACTTDVVVIDQGDEESVLQQALDALEPFLANHSAHRLHVGGIAHEPA